MRSMLCRGGSRLKQRVAIIHFTGPPAIGGIESTISAQADALHEAGVGVRVITGVASQVAKVENVVIPALHPADHHVAAERQRLETGFPDPEHALVRAIASEIGDLLRDCSACWAHNAFTVYLNPFLTVALWRRATLRPDLSWVAWCEDLTGTSAFQ